MAGEFWGVRHGRAIIIENICFIFIVTIVVSGFLEGILGDCVGNPRIVLFVC